MTCKIINTYNHILNKIDKSIENYALYLTTEEKKIVKYVLMHYGSDSNIILNNVSHKINRRSVGSAVCINRKEKALILDYLKNYISTVYPLYCPTHSYLAVELSKKYHHENTLPLLNDPRCSGCDKLAYFQCQSCQKYLCRSDGDCRKNKHRNKRDKPIDGGVICE